MFGFSLHIVESILQGRSSKELLLILYLYQNRFLFEVGNHDVSKHAVNYLSNHLSCCSPVWTFVQFSVCLMIRIGFNHSVYYALNELLTYTLWFEWLAYFWKVHFFSCFFFPFCLCTSMWHDSGSIWHADRTNENSFCFSVLISFFLQWNQNVPFCFLSCFVIYLMHQT